MVAEMCSVAGAMPLAGVTVSHGESLEVVKLSAPLPVLVTHTRNKRFQRLFFRGWRSFYGLRCTWESSLSGIA